MRLPIILRTTGALLVLFSPAMLVPATVAWIYGEATVRTFAIAFGVTLAGGIALWICGRGRLGPREGDGFLITALAYIGLGAVRRRSLHARPQHPARLHRGDL